jgi:O-6-methylguanine DNA methyltransferase
MISDISLSPVRILDAPRLKSAGLTDLKLQDVSSELRDTISNSSKLMYLATMISDPGQELIAYVGLESIHQVHQNALISCRFSRHVHSPESIEPDSCKNVTVHICSSSLGLTIEVKKKVVDALLRVAFFSLNLHKVSWIIPAADVETEEIALACGMHQEAVLEEAMCFDDTFVDAGQFSLLASEYPDYAVAFISFPRGVVAVRGSATAVEGIRFYSYGEKITDPFEKRVAIRTGAADSSGKLLKENADSFHQTQIHLPEEVSKSARELREYFSKARTKFTVRVNFPYGSDFQRHVWQELQKIPYGTTVSYEDIALALTGNDKVAARNLSRAVGSACADNPIPILIPCHRVIGKDGRLVGFSGGVENKEFLLEHEIFGFFRDVQ